MKEYNAKIIVNNDELKIAFECDKEKNKECKGYRNCRECNYTTNTRYMKAKYRQIKSDINDKELVTNSDSEIEYYRDKIRLLENAVKNKNKWLKEYQDILRSIIIKQEDIFKLKSINEVRILLGYKPLNMIKKRKIKGRGGQKSILANPEQRRPRCSVEKTP